MGRIVEISENLLVLGITSPTEVERAMVQICIGPAEGAIKRHLNYDPVQATRTEYYPQFEGANSGESVWEVNDSVAYMRSLAGGSADILQVQHLPIRSITSLKVDYDGRSGTREGAFASETAWTEGTDFFPNYDKKDSSGIKMCTDGMIRSEGRWPERAGSVELIYVAGYTAAELRGQDSVVDASPIWEAVLDEVTRRVHKHYSRMKKALTGFVGGALTSESLGDYSYSVDGATLSKLVGGSFDLLPETEIKLEKFVNYGWSLSGG